MKLRLFPSENELAEAVADRLDRVIKGRSHGVLGLPTGRTPLPAYARWTTRTGRSADELRWLRIFGLDELCGLPAEHPATFRHYLEKHVAGPLGLLPEQLRTFPCTRDADPLAYERELEAAGGMSLALLGLGANGHIAFNEPGERLEVSAHKVMLSEGTRRANAWLFSNGLEAVPQEAFTLGMGSLLKAREVLLIAVGEAKAAAVADAIYGPLRTQCPASLLQLHPHCEVWTDSAAGQLARRQA